MQGRSDDKKGEHVYEGIITSESPYKKDETGVPTGHGRFYCEKCQAPYDLPQGATSWRCTNCMTFNSTTPPECPCCTIQ